MPKHAYTYLWTAVFSGGFVRLIPMLSSLLPPNSNPFMCPTQESCVGNYHSCCSAEETETVAEAYPEGSATETGERNCKNTV